MKIDGGCHCGAITYEAEADPGKTGICHCTDCQTLGGSAFRIGVPVDSSSYRLLSGTPKTYIKTAESGGKRAQVFCPDCGTHLYSTSVEDNPPIFRVRTSTARQRTEFVPVTQGWFRSSVSWIGDIASIPAREKQ